jgi:hypothetical protein
MNTSDLYSSKETGTLQIMYLKRFWQKKQLIRTNQISQEQLPAEWHLDKMLLSALGLGLEQTLSYLFRMAPSFEAFERWIVDVAGVPSPQNVARFNQYLQAGASAISAPIVPVLSEQEIGFWENNGYLVIPNAVPKEDCLAAVQIINDLIGVSLEEPNSWYQSHVDRQGIMIQLFQHPVLQKNRFSDKIRMVFEELWNRTDLWVSTDRVGFNPPERADWTFPGPDLHWDVSLQLPIPFGLQGLLYLADTEANQGAFTLVPGFHKRLESWLQSLPPGADPRKQDLHSLGSFPVAAQAGDFIVWHQALPHGSSPNTAHLPRYVQYINYAPYNDEPATGWK